MRFRDLERKTFGDMKRLQEFYLSNTTGGVSGMEDLILYYNCGEGLAARLVKGRAVRWTHHIDDDEPVWVVKPKRKRGRSDN